MDDDRIEGKLKQSEGEVQETWGDAKEKVGADGKADQAEGKAKQGEGDLKEAWGEAKEKDGDVWGEGEGRPRQRRRAESLDVPAIGAAAPHAAPGRAISGL
jgi:uncharacterized protein YjbJ (UPF0337 family)